MRTPLSPSRRLAPALVWFTVLLQLTGCSDDTPSSSPTNPGASSPATSNAPAGGGLVAAADVKPVDLTALGRKVVTDKATLAIFPTVYLPDASVCPGTKDLVPQADGTGASSFRPLTPIIAAEGLQALFVVSTLAVQPAELVSAINKAVAGCADVKVIVAENTPRAGVTRIQVNYRTPKFNNGANGGRAVAGLTYIAPLKDGSYVTSNLFGDPSDPNRAPRYDLNDPFTVKLLNAAGVA